MCLVQIPNFHSGSGTLHGGTKLELQTPPGNSKHGAQPFRDDPAAPFASPSLLEPSLRGHFVVPLPANWSMNTRRLYDSACRCTVPLSQWRAVERSWAPEATRRKNHQTSLGGVGLRGLDGSAPTTDADVRRPRGIAHSCCTRDTHPAQISAHSIASKRGVVISECVCGVWY